MPVEVSWCQHRYWLRPHRRSGSSTARSGPSPADASGVTASAMTWPVGPGQYASQAVPCLGEDGQQVGRFAALGELGGQGLTPIGQSQGAGRIR